MSTVKVNRIENTATTAGGFLQVCLAWWQGQSGSTSGNYIPRGIHEGVVMRCVADAEDGFLCRTTIQWTAGVQNALVVRASYSNRGCWLRIGHPHVPSLHKGCSCVH